MVAPRPASLLASASTRFLRVWIGSVRWPLAWMSRCSRFLTALASGTTWNQMLGPWPSGSLILLLGHPQLAVEVVPGSESSRGRRELIAQRGGPEPSQPVRVGTVDDQLEADRHRFPPQAARVATGILPDTQAAILPHSPTAQNRSSQTSGIEF